MQLIVDFLAAKSGGPLYYRGREMKLSHVGMKIDGEDWAALMKHLNATLDKFKVPAKEHARGGRVYRKHQGGYRRSALTIGFAAGRPARRENGGLPAHALWRAYNCTAPSGSLWVDERNRSRGRRCLTGSILSKSSMQAGSSD